MSKATTLTINRHWVKAFHFIRHWQGIIRADGAKQKSDTSAKFQSGLIIASLIFGGYFFYLFPNVFFETAQGISAGWIGVWADWSVHNTYTSVFAYRPVSEWFGAHPLYLGRKFTYPFLANLISGLFMRLGFDRVTAFVVPSILTAFVLVWCLYALYWKVFKNTKLSLLAQTLFFTSGGLGFWWWLKDLWRTQSLDTIWFPPLEYTHIGEIKLEWINVISGQLLPQRAFLLGMAMLLGILVTLLHWSEQHFTKVKYWQLLMISLGSSALLLAHVHSFIVLVIVCTVWVGMSSPKAWPFWLRFAAITSIPSIMVYSWLYGGEIGVGFFKWLPGWLANPAAKNINWVWFWFLNWGFFLPVAALGTWMGKWYRHPLVVSGWMLFIVANLVLFQPYDWDNSKILTWSYMFLCIPVASVLQWLWEKKPRALRAAGWLLFTVLILSGLLDIWRLTHTNRLTNLMWSPADITIADDFRRLSPPNAIVLAADKHNHWVSTLAGRQMLLGYRGWMWTYGIIYNDRERDMQVMFAGGEAARALLQQYGVQYVIIGPAERFDWDANELWYQENYPVVLQNNEYSVYAIL